MTGISDRSWEIMIDRIDLDFTDADLAAAEQQLQELAPEELAPVRPEWLDATVAKVRAEAAERDAAAAAPAPIHKLSLVRRLQRFAAAAAAVVGINSFAAAATVTTVGVVAVAAIVIWKAGVFSNQTMSFRMAIDIQLRADQPAGDRVTALTQVYRRLHATIQALERVRDSAQTSTSLVEGAKQALQTLESELLGSSTPMESDVADVFESSLAVLEDPNASEPLRVQHLQMLLAASQTGVSAILRMPQGEAEVDEARAVLLAKLIELAGR